MPQDPSAGPGMLSDLAGPAGTEIYMKEALEQVVDLLRTPAEFAMNIRISSAYITPKIDLQYRGSTSLFVNIMRNNRILGRLIR